MDALHNAETLVLSVAATLLPALVDTHVIGASAAVIAGSLCSGVAAGLHLPAGVQAVAARRGVSVGGAGGTDALEAEISQVASRIIAGLTARTAPAPDPHGDRPNS